MGSVANPAMMLPGINPSGSSINLSPWSGGGQGSSSANPYAPIQVSGAGGVSGGPYGSTVASPALLPFQQGGNAAPSSPVPVGTTAPGTGSPTATGSSAGANTPSSAGAALGVPTTTAGQNKLLQSLNKAYGSGVGTMLYNFLAGGAGYNQTAINNLIASLQPGFNTDQTNLMQQFSASGNRFGSGAQIGEATLEGQEQLDVGQLETQMYEQSIQDFINVMMGAASGSNARKLQAGQATTNMIDTLVPAALGASSSDYAAAGP